MRNRNNLFITTATIFFCFALLSCTGTGHPFKSLPVIYYLGDSYPSSAAVEIYYDVKEVKKEFKVMGRMTNDKYMEYDVDLIKRKMMEKAKLVGVDAVIFYDLSTEDIEKIGDGISVKAQLIKYL